MHSRHRIVCHGPAVGVRAFARRAAAVVGVAVAVASFALPCAAQELGGSQQTAGPGVPGGRSSTMLLQERLRLYQQLRQRRSLQGTRGLPGGRAPASQYEQRPLGGSDVAATARTADGIAPLDQPRPFNATGSQGLLYPLRPGSNTDSSSIGPSSPPVYVPTQEPDEVIDPSDGPRQVSAMIPETIPRTDTAYDPNLLPPPPPQPQPSTWQIIRQKGVALQNTYSRATWLFRGDGDDTMGMFDVYTQATFGFPLLPGVSLTPSFQAYFPDGPTQTDVPAQLYSIQAQIRSLIPLNKQFVMDLSVIPGVFSDFQQGSSESFRLQARAIGLYIQSPTSQIVFGVLYLDRFDINWLPTGGWIYVPNPDWRLELVFPQPKIARRLSLTPNFSRWAYLSGEFGGDAWAIQRTTGATDRLVYRDWRLIAGFEQKYANGRLLFVEAGFVFNRKVEYASKRGDFDPSSTGLLRAGLIY